MGFARLGSGLVIVCAAACGNGGGAPTPAEPSSAVEVPPVPPAPPAVDPPAAPRAEGPPCPIAPVRLVLDAPSLPPGVLPTAIAGMEAARLAANGEVFTSFSGGKGVARLDPRGCIRDDTSVWVERQKDGRLWTLRSITRVEQDDLVLETGRRMRIAPDGRITALDANGQAEPGSAIGLRLDGYSPEARCSGQLLLMTFLSMMPSMAVADGVARTLPPPADSVCPLEP